MGFLTIAQASSAQGIELFEDLLWDLASLSFVTHVFEPSLTFFPGNIGTGSNESPKEVAEAEIYEDEMSEAIVCTELVSLHGHVTKKWLRMRDGRGGSITRTARAPILCKKIRIILMASLALAGP